MEEEKKDNKKSLAIIFLSILVIALASYIVIDKTNIFKEKECPQQKSAAKT